MRKKHEHWTMNCNRRHGWTRVEDQHGKGHIKCSVTQKYRSCFFRAQLNKNTFTETRWYGQRSRQKPNDVFTYLKMNGDVWFDLRLQITRIGLQRSTAAWLAETRVEVSVFLPQQRKCKRQYNRRRFVVFDICYILSDIFILHTLLATCN